MEVKHLSFSYGERKILNDVSFTAEYGELLSVLGPNGVGKSTLFRCILGLLKPEQGFACIDEKPIEDMTPHELSQYIAYIPQSHNPTFNFSVLDMVLMGTTSQMGAFASPNRKCKKQALDALKRLGIHHLKDRGYAVIQSTHDPDQAYLYSDKILALYNGEVMAFGTPKETIGDEFISKLYGVDVEVCSMRDDSVRVCVPCM